MKSIDIKYIVIHCSATRSNMTYSAWQLDQDHRARGFSMAGYHFYIPRSGSIESLRPLNMAGAHVLHYNHCSIGVCYEGGLRPDGTPSDTRTPAQRKALERLLACLISMYPKASIVGHRDLSPDLNHNGIIEPSEWLKACPCFNAHLEYFDLWNKD